MQSKEQEVFAAIKPYFPQTDKRRILFISMLIVSLLKLTDARLSRWAKAIAHPTLVASRFKRLQRFMRQFRFAPKRYAQLVWSFFGQADQIVLTLDRTEFEQQGVWVQVLMLCIAYKGMCIPLLWRTANRWGNASLAARRALLKALLAWLPRRTTQQLYLVADREFIGKECRQSPLIPLIRIRSNALVGPKGKARPARDLFTTNT